jgi:hypothetical protein
VHKRMLQVPFEDAAEGCQWLARDLKDSKVLLVLDDVWRREDLRHLDFATCVTAATRTADSLLPRATSACCKMQRAMRWTVCG